MKKITALLIAIACYMVVGAQTPYMMNFQGVARNSVGNVVANKNISVRLTVHDGTATGPTVYRESRLVTTNPFGLFNIVIGSTGALNVTGTVPSVNWLTGAKFIQLEVDPEGGNAFANIGTTQLVSVPYAFAAATATPGGAAGGDLTGTYPNPILTNTTATPGSYGNANNYPTLTVDAKGRITGISQAPLPTSLPPNGAAGGDLTGTYPNPILTNTAVTAGTYGNATNYSTFTVDGKGRITAAAQQPLPSGLPPTGAAGGDLAGTYPNPTIAIPLIKTSSQTANPLIGMTNSSATGTLGAIQATSASNDASAVALQGTLTSTTPGGFSSAVRGINNGTGGLGIGVWGSQAASGWGVYGSTASGVGVNGNGGTGIGVLGSSSSGTGVIGSTSTGIAGNFSITNAANTNAALVAATSGDGSAVDATTSSTSASISAIKGTINSTSPGGFSAAVRGINNGTGGLGIGVWGSQAGSGWGVYGATASGVGVNGNGGTGIGVLGSSSSGTGVIGSTSTGIAGSFSITNAANANNVLEAATAGDGAAINATTSSTAASIAAIRGEISSISPGGFSAAVRGINQGTGGLGIGVWGSQAGSGWGVYGATAGGVGVNGNGGTGIGVLGSSSSGTGVIGNSSTGIAGSFSLVNAANGNNALTATTAGTGFAASFTSTNAAPLALHTTGGVQLTGISEGPGKVLTSDASGNATWQTFSATGITGAGTLDFIPKYTPSGTALGNSQIFDDGNNIGINNATPTYKLDILHGGSTGIRNKSTSSYSAFDIDGATGDAALRFVNNGVNQWNVRNQPGTNNLQIFELGGGGERFVIENGTGNISIGAGSTPTYKLDILHGGSTGIRNKSTSSYSAFDLDGATGDAALRFVNNGVNQWNVRNQPGTNNFQIFELGGGGERFQIEDATGNISIGNATPTHKLHVLHAGSSGAKIESASSFSTVDIDAFSGDAALRFQKGGTGMWNTRNNPGTDDYEIFELGSGSRFRIQDGTGFIGINVANPTVRLHVGGDFTATGTKAFTIDHPLDPENKMLRHFAVESNEVLNSYSGNVTTDASGKVTVQLPDYFEAINKDFRYQLTTIGSFAQAIISKKISNNTFEIATSQPNVEVSWEVKGVRNDGYMKNVNQLKAEEMKPASMRGKYIEPKAFNLPESRGVNFDKSESIADNSVNPKTMPVIKQSPKIEQGGSLDPVVTPPAKPLPALATSGGSLGAVQ